MRACVQVICTWTQIHVLSCCCLNFKKFVKFWSCLEVIKIWFVLEKIGSIPVKLRKKGVKSLKSDNIRGKSAMTNWSFQRNFNTVNWLFRGKRFLRFQKAGANSQSSKIGAKSSFYFERGQERQISLIKLLGGNLFSNPHNEFIWNKFTL